MTKNHEHKAIQLCFIWIHKFKNLENFSINLSNTHEFNFEPKNRSLYRVDREAMPQLFGSDITSVTGILGINGSGKTNSLELICHALSDPEKLKHDYLLIYSVGNDFYHASNLSESITSNFDIAQSENHTNKFKPLFFSNVYDRNFINFDSNVIDVSTNNKNNPRTIALQRDIRESDFLNDVEFFTSQEFLKIELNAPPRIEIKIDRFFTKHDRSLEKERSWPIMQYLFKTRRNNRDKGHLHLVKQAIQMDFIRALLKADHQEPCINILESILNKNPDMEFTEFLGQTREHYFNNDARVPWNNSFSLHAAFTVLFKLESFLSEMLFSFDDTIKGSRYTFSIDFELSETWWIKNLACILQGLSYSSISWTGVSSGQRAYLNLFSSIWNGISNQKSASKIKQATLICIDEGDLYLHPQWQIEFIDRLIKGIPKLSQGKIQIIFTTHSPILISDLPHQCTVLLNHESDFTECMASQGTDRPKTFAANIYDIYQYAFGLNEKRGGNLSSRYIAGIFKTLDKPYISSEDTLDLKLALSIIDDDIIKFHILKRINGQ